MNNIMLNSVPIMWVREFKNSEMYEYAVYIPPFKNITPKMDMINTPVVATFT